METVIAAAVQATPVFLDRDATIEKSVALIKEASSTGARLIAFPETFVPTYPEWVWRLSPWDGPSSALYARLLRESVEVPGPATDAIGRAARAAKAYVSIGVDERDPAGSTVYNTQLYFAPDGSILGKHRKLMPTGAERLVWGYGDGSTLDVWETPFGRLGGLICWENYMPLARAALYAKGIDVWVASTWDDDPTWVSTLQHIAKEGRVHVIGVNSVIRGTDVPSDVPGYADVWKDDDGWMSRGRSAIVRAGGEVIAGPLVEEEGIIYAELDAEEARGQRVRFDPVGHYSRPDVFELVVHEERRAAVSASGRGERGEPVTLGREDGEVTAATGRRARTKRGGSAR
jgi:nitrilase